MELKYDQTSPQSIETFGKRLIDGTLRTVIGVKKIPNPELERRISAHGRGSFGELVETFYYDIHPGNDSVPDFTEAGVELKTTPIKQIRSARYSAKERLVLGLINYREEAKRSFQTSSFFTKNERLMIISYLHDKGVVVGDLIVKIAKLVEYEKLPLEDRKIIHGDWEKIIEKIRAGKAHELSEGDTLYLGACTKSSDSSVMRTQVGDIPAKPRAYSFKSGYMTELVRRELEGEASEDERALKPSEAGQPMSFEDLIIKKFQPLIGKTVEEIHAFVGKGLNDMTKDYHAALARRMMGVKGARVMEFDAAEISMKTIQLRKDGMPKEHMSFPAFKYKEIVQQVWDGDEGPGGARAAFQEQVEKRFFFVIYQCGGDCKRGDQRRLKKVMFWSMPFDDRREAEKTWRKTVRQIKAGRADDLPGVKENRVAHVRPHARDSSDTDETPDKQHLVKKCFWLNQAYLKEVVK